MSYGKVHDVFWDSDTIDSLSDQAALLGLFLISGPHRNAIGCFKLGIGAITDIPRFVSVRGGAYFFLPGLTALRRLASP